MVAPPAVDVPIVEAHLRWLGGVLGLYALSEPPDPNNLAEILPELKLWKYPARTSFIREGESGTDLYVLYSGAVVVSVGGKRVAELQPGAIIGEIGFITGSPRTATVTTAYDSEVFALSNMIDFMAKYMGLRDFLMKTAQHRMLELCKISNRPSTSTLPAIGEGQPAMSKRVLGGRYETNSVLGEGGMGRVYLGLDRSLDRKVAIKQLHAGTKASPAARARFLQEAKTIARVAHPYIVSIYDILDDEGELFLVMEFINGSPISSLIDQGRRFTLSECEGFFTFICKAVACAHWNNILHRDLKPANVMLDHMGFAKVMDFGLARQDVLDEGRRELLGTPTHMAPEQHWGKSKITSDVYSLGVCLYEMLTGEVPFKGPDFAEQKKRGDFAAPSSLQPALRGTKIDEFLSSALAPEPEKRPRHVLLFLDGLRTASAK